MKQILLFLVGVCMINLNASAERASATFTTSVGNNIQVMVNGRVMNIRPKPYVQIVGRPGVHDIKIRVYNRRGYVKLVHFDKIKVRPGYKSEFTLYYKGYDTRLENTANQRLKIKKYRDPDRIYKERFFSMIQRPLFRPLHNPGQPDTIASHSNTWLARNIGRIIHGTHIEQYMKEEFIYS